MFIIDGTRSHPDDFPLLPKDGESDGDVNMCGQGSSSGFCRDGDTHLFGSRRSSGFGHADGEMFNVRLERFSALGDIVLVYTSQNFTTPQFQQTKFQQSSNHSVSSGPISLIGNTCRVGHGDDLSMPDIVHVSIEGNAENDHEHFVCWEFLK